MWAIRLFLLKSCIFGVYILVTEASVLLQTSDGDTTYFKGSSVELVCTIIPYYNVMIWLVDNEPYADCFLGTCSYSPNKPYTFTFTFNESAGEFKLTIDSVNSSHATLSFACDDGNVRETISINVTIVSVANVVLSGPSSSFIKEHSRQTIKCKTSRGRPQPRVSWYLYDSNKSVKNKITVNSSTQILNESEDGLVAVESTLQFYPNRSINNWMLNCEAWTDDETRAVHSNILTLNIAYKALILKYSVLNSGAHDSVTVAENETVSLQCEIEGNPTPTCEIYNEHNSEMEHQINYSHNYATCFINFKASCLHFGVYKCKGANVINTPGYTEKTINIFVECSPRPSPSVPVRNRVIAEMNSSISLYFTALSYPKPNSVLWSKFDGKAWNYVNESNNIRIYQSNLDFGMTIIRASKADFGEYKLFISNIVGSYTHIFYIEHSMVSSKSDVQGNTGLIIGLTIVVIFLATIISVFGVILYKRRRNLKRPDVDVNNSYLNVSGANTQQKCDDKEYEIIGSNMKDSENKVNGNSKSIEDMEENNDISATYEKLTDDRKDINQYSQICYMKEKQRGYGKSMSSGKDEQHTELAKNYINMRI